jgi:PAS domain S-box-containing protein
MDWPHPLCLIMTGLPVAMAGIATDITGQVEAANELNRRDACLKAIIENQPGMLWRKDADGVMLAANGKFAAGHGFAQAVDVQGKTDYDLVEKSLADRYARIDYGVMTSGVPVVLVEQYPAADGSIRSIEVLISPVCNEDGQCIGTTGYAHDVTERIMMRKNYEDFFNAIDDMLFVADLDGHIIKANTAAILRLGYSNDELSGMAYYELLEEKFRAEAGLVVKAQLEGRLSHWKNPLLPKRGPDSG